MSQFQQATDYGVKSIKIQGTEMRQMFYELSIYEHIYASAITGEVVFLATGSNQFLAELQIEGNEEIEIDIAAPDQPGIKWKGYLNRIANRILAGGITSSYVIEFVSPIIRANEQIYQINRWKNENAKNVIEDCIKRWNQVSDIPIKTDKNKSESEPMNFISGRWHPTRTIHYCLKNAVPTLRGGKTTLQGGGESADPKPREGKAKGLGGLLFWETLKGVRTGSSVQVMRGEVGEPSKDMLNYTLGNQGEGIDKTRNYILAYENIQNNDAQAQTRTGAFKAIQVAFNMDTGIYSQQEWVSELATQKQLDTSKLPTRYYNTPINPEGWNNDCEKAKSVNEYQKKLLTTLQEPGTHQNIQDNQCQFTTPIRTDLNVGDQVDTTIYEVSVDSVAARDPKFSGKWTLAAVAHTFYLESNAAYTKLTCIRATNQDSEASAMGGMSAV